MIEIPALFDELVAFLSLFVGMAPQLRATGDHVEYESDSWIRALGVSMDLSRMTWIVGQGWATARADELLYALEVVTRRIRDIAWLKESSLDPTKFAPPEFLQVQALGLSHVVIHFEVRYNWISIHNPVHYLYGELLKHASHLVDTSRVKWSAERDDDSATLGVQVIAEYPLRSEWCSTFGGGLGVGGLTRPYSHHVSCTGQGRPLGPKWHRYAWPITSLSGTSSP